MVTADRPASGTVVLRARARFKLQNISPDQWRASHTGLGLIVYAATAQEAQEKMVRALDFLYDSLMAKGGPERLRSQLKAAEVEFELEPVVGGTTEVDFPERVLEPA
ncbi:MAG: hypothetical protein GEU75_05855 [Dehalococcoidia bacterium]|nr:hypothetical protein [Dehalococcoidia bacterium]